MKDLMLVFILFFLVVGCVVFGYLEYKRLKKETDSRVEMYDSINRNLTDISFSLRNIDFYFHLYHVDKIVNKESEE